MPRRTSRKKTTRTASFAGVGKGFAAEQEYLVTVKECDVEEGDNGLYYSLKLEGNDEFEGSLMYHNASLSPSALWRTREVFEAFLGEVPEDDFDVDEYAEMFVGKTAMCSTFKDTYNGQSRIKPEDFWPAEEGAGGSEEEGEAEDIDLDDLEDADIKKLGKAMGIKSKRASTIRKELEEADEGELEEAMIEVGLIEAEDEGEEEGDEFDLDEASDDDIKAVAKAAGISVTAKSRINTLKKKLNELDDDELAEAVEEAGIGGAGGEGGDVTAEEIAAMNQDELEELVEEHELDVDLDKLKTLRKKRTAVVDAAEEAGILSED
jgi:hypothetical protein